MRYTMRMFLIPEEIFLSIAQPQATSDGTPIGLVRSRIQQIEKSKELNDDAKAAHYQQEFKRLNKLTKEQEERPMDVRVQNAKEISNTPTSPSPQNEKHSKRAVNKPKFGRKTRKQTKHKQSKEVNDEEEENWQDASSEASPAKPSDVQSTSTADIVEQTPRSALMEHVMKNSAKLGLNSEGKILRAYDGYPFKTSNIEEIVSYLLNEDKRSQFKSMPVGYKDFVERAKSDPVLAKYLFHQSGKGAIVNFKRYKNVNSTSRPFIFRPSLWY